jgi:hypothetical protein
MSDKNSDGGGFAPARTTRLSVRDLESLFSLFKQLNENATIKWCIYAAGAAALLDIVHNLVLAIAFVRRHVS